VKFGYNLSLSVGASIKVGGRVGDKEYRERLGQIFEFLGGRIYCKRIKQIKYISQTLKEIVDLLYPRVVRARVLYEVGRNDMIILLACGHIVNMMFGEPNCECSICYQVWKLYDFAMALWRAFGKKVNTRIALKRLRDKISVDNMGRESADVCTSK
jgi:hypothetical protein